MIIQRIRFPSILSFIMQQINQKIALIDHFIRRLDQVGISQVHAEKKNSTVKCISEESLSILIEAKQFKSKFDKRQSFGLARKKRQIGLELGSTNIGMKDYKLAKE